MVLAQHQPQTFVKIARIYISKSHNFFGHHGKPSGKEPMARSPTAECVAGSGIRGDRFFDYKPDYKGQITFFSWEVYESLCARFSHQCEPSAFRRNVLVKGVDLNTLIEQEFELQGVRFLGTEEARPCHWMEEAFGPGAEEALRGKGGLRAKILSNGELHEEIE